MSRVQTPSPRPHHHPAPSIDAIAMPDGGCLSSPHIPFENPITFDEVALYMPPTIKDILTLPTVRRSVIEVSPTEVLLQLMRCSRQWYQEVIWHLFKETSHFTLLRAENGLAYKLASVTISGNRALGRPISWWTPNPDFNIMGSTVITLPAFRAGAVLRFLHQCDEQVPEEQVVGRLSDDGPTQTFEDAVEAAFGTEFESVEEDEDDGGIATSEMLETVPSSPIVDDEPTPWDYVPASDTHVLRGKGKSNALCVRWSDGGDERDLHDHQHPDDEQTSPTERELAIRRDFHYPPNTLSTWDVVRLDCSSHGDSGQAIAGTMPFDVHTIVLNLNLRIMDRDDFILTLKELSRTAVAAYWDAIRGGSRLDVAHTLFKRARLYEALYDSAEADTAALAYSVPVLSGSFDTLVLNLNDMHEDAVLSLQLLSAPLQRIVVVCGRKRWPGWRESHDWAEQPHRRWGVLQQVLETFIDEEVKIEIVDARYVGGMLGCEYEALPRWDWNKCNHVAEVRYFDSERDVGPGLAISREEWALWTEFDTQI